MIAFGLLTSETFASVGATGIAAVAVGVPLVMGVVGIFLKNPRFDGSDAPGDE